MRYPTQLPPAAGDFTGRHIVLSEAADALEASSVGGVPGSVPLLNLCGRPGVGKTTLALVLGHRVRERYKHGQFFVHLGGATPNPRPVHEVLGELLLSLGIEPAALPDGVSARAALFRQLSTDRSLLIVIDDAADERQIAPLLPGAPSAVVVTSRRPLAGLPGVRTVDVDVLSHQEGAELLTKIMGPHRADAAVEAVARIASSCAGLPLALRIAGARLASRPNLPVAALAVALDDERRRLDELRFADLEVRATLNLACAALSEQHRSAFALLGRLDAPSVSRWTLGALVGYDEVATQVTLDALVDARLVDAGPTDEFGEVRYTLHDLLRLFAREMPAPRGSWIRGLRDVAGRWLTLAETADAALPVTSDVVTRGASTRVAIPEDLTHRVRSQPLPWFRSEEAAIAAEIDQLVAEGLSGQAWELASLLRTYVVLQSRSWDVWSRTHRTALSGCRARHDRRGEASMQFGLGKLRIDVHGAAHEERRSSSPPRDCSRRSVTWWVRPGLCTTRPLELALRGARPGRAALRPRPRTGPGFGDAEVLADVLYMTGRVENGLGHDEKSVAASSVR